MAACPPLLALVRDDLCLAILKMTKGGYTVEVRLRKEQKLPLRVMGLRSLSGAMEGCHDLPYGTHA